MRAALCSWLLLGARGARLRSTLSYALGVAQYSAYGTIKRLGEIWVAQLPLGRSARFWNVYGPVAPPPPPGLPRLCPSLMQPTPALQR